MTKETPEAQSVNHTPSSVNKNSLSTHTTTTLPREDIFPTNVAGPLVKTELSQSQKRIEKIDQLVYCCTLLRRGSSSSTNDKKEVEWLKEMSADPIRQDHVYWLVNKVVEEYITDQLKDAAKTAEVVALGSVLDREHYRKLLSSIISEFENASMLDFVLLQGLTQLVQVTSPDFLEPDDLIRILRILRTRIEGAHGQPTEHIFLLILAVSHVLDVMADHNVKDLNRVIEHEPLSGILSVLSSDSDPYVMYQACYAFQALQYVPDDETVLQAALRHSSGVASGLVKVAGLMKLDLNVVIEGLSDLQRLLGSTFEIASAAYEGMCSVRESGQSVIDSLKKGYGTGKKFPWYVAIRAARAFVHAGQLRDLNQLICKAPCRDDPLFQWGICQLLGEIASDSIWEMTIRQQAVELLGELLKNDPAWGQDGSIKIYMQTILKQISKHSNEAVNAKARILLNELKLDQVTIDNPLYPLQSCLPLPAFSPLLTRVQNIPYLEHDLNAIRLQRLQERRKGVYIPPQARPSLQSSTDGLFPLMEKVIDFLSSCQQVFLILGDSGAGKSTFNLELEHTLWKRYKSQGPIPLYINLPTIDNPSQDLIEKQLQTLNFSDVKIREMKLHRQFVLICDGYDESQLLTNLYTTNQFNQPGQWNVKMVLTCRTQFLGQDYRSRFLPQSIHHYQQTPTDLFQEAVIAAFTRVQIQQYVDEYVKELPTIDPLYHWPSWTAEEYMEKLTNIPNLMELVSNPFLLALSLDALPAIVESNKDLPTIKITRVQLYDSFVKRWLKVNCKRLEESPLEDCDRTELDMLMEDNFLYHGIKYQKDLGVAIFIDHGGNPVVKYIPLQDKKTWKAAFFGSEGHIRLLRESSTVMRSGMFFRFLHRSLLEYFYARTIYDPVDYLDNTTFAGDDSSGHVDHDFDIKKNLARMNIVNEPSILQFLAERVSQDPKFQQQLQDIVEESKVNMATEAIQTAAANAISILVKANVRFNGTDLQDIKIPGADLSEGQFDSVQFQRADLTNVNFSRAWMRHADLTDACLEGVRFGELPYLGLDSNVMVCAYSPDGSMLAVGLEKGDVVIYSTAHWEQIQCLPDVHQVLALAFTPDGKQIVSSGQGRVVRLRDIATGENVLVMKGHDNRVKSVAFSPCGAQIASSSHDLRLWDAQTGECVDILTGHTWMIGSVMYSPDGRVLVSGSEDGTIRFWDPKTGEPLGNVLKPSLGEVHHLAWSPNGQWIASTHNDGGMQLWNASTREPGPILSGHSEKVTRIVFSPNSLWLASSAEDHTVKMWDVSTGALVSSLVGHHNFVNSVAFSPDGVQMASGGADMKVRLWEVNSSLSFFSSSSSSLSSSSTTPSSSSSTVNRRSAKSKNGPVWKVVYSPDGKSILSVCNHTFRQWSTTDGEMGSKTLEFPESHWMESTEFSQDGQWVLSSAENNGTIQLWDLSTISTPVQRLLEGHSSRIVELAYSPCGRWIASASWDNSVRLWDLHNLDRSLVLAGTGEDIFETVGDLKFISTCPSRLVVSSSKGTIRIFESESGDLKVSKKLSRARIQQVASSPDGKQLALGIDFSIHLWSVDSSDEETMVELKGHSSYVYCMAYSPCGTWIVSGSDDRTVRVWHRQSAQSHPWNKENNREDEKNPTWSLVAIIRGFFGTIQTLDWSPINDLEFVTGCLDGSLRVWKVMHHDRSTVEDKEIVQVQLIWGTNLRFLCAEGLIFEGGIGLDSVQRRLIEQRGGGSVTDRGVDTKEDGDGWGMNEATASGDEWGATESSGAANEWGYVEQDITFKSTDWKLSNVSIAEGNGYGWATLNVSEETTLPREDQWED